MSLRSRNSRTLRYGNDANFGIGALAAAIFLWGLIALPPLRGALEVEMASQMAVQLPLLVLVGSLLALALRPFEPRWLREADRFGAAGLVLALFVLAVWMLPRSLDGALAEPHVEAAKFLSLPLLAGLPLASSWPRLPGIAKGVVVANFLSMLGTVGGLYLAAPSRLCAYYRIDQQVATGKTLLALAGALGISWFAAAFCGWPRPRPGPLAGVTGKTP